VIDFLIDCCIDSAVIEIENGGWEIKEIKK